MATIEEVKKKLQQNGMASQLQGPAQTGEQTPQNIITQQVANAIKSAAKDVQEKKEAVRRGEGLDLQYISEKALDLGAGTDARQREPMELDEGDGLQRMIREAKAKTDQLSKPGGLLGGNSDLAGSGLKLQQAAALQPMNQDQEERSWTDSSYLTPNPTTGVTRTGKTIADNAGQLTTDAAGKNWMGKQDGSLLDVSQKTQEEIAALQKQMQDTSYQVTGRVYRLNQDGSTPQWLSVGDQVVTAGGTYIITGHKYDGGYTSELYDPNQTTDSFKGNYNTGTYGSIIGEQNGNIDHFKGNRESNGAFTGYGGYSVNPQNGKMQFDTVSFTFDGEWTPSAIQDGVAYELDARGNLKPMEAGSLVQDASQRYWIVGADGRMIDVTPADPINNPLNDPTGEVGRIQRTEAEKAGLDLNRKRKAEQEAANQIDPATQRQIDQLQLQLEREQSAIESANRELYRQYRQGQEQLKEQLVGAGLNTSGVSEKAQAQLTAEYLSGMNTNQQQGRMAEEDVAYQIQSARLQAQQEAQRQAQAEAQQRAATLAQYGDFSGYRELGYTADQIAGMEAAYAQQNAVDNRYKGLSDYALTLLDLYRANPGYDIRSGLQQALDNGLISQQDYLAALQTAAGMTV